MQLARYENTLTLIYRSPVSISVPKIALEIVKEMHESTSNFTITTKISSQGHQAGENKIN